MKVLLVLAALVAFAAADCNTMARLKVKEQWHQVYGTGGKRIEAGRVLWRAMFSHDPESRELFKRVSGDDVNSAAFAAHSIRVLGGLEMAIDLLDHEEILEKVLAHLKEQHDERNIARSHVLKFKEVLMAVVPASLGRCFDADAWSACLDVIGRGIFGAAH